MKTSILTLPLLLICAVVQAQTTTPIDDKNIKDCYKKSSKGPSAFDYCVAEEFRRVKEEKTRREARIAAGKDPDRGCGKNLESKECFDELMADMRKISDGLYEGSGSNSDYVYLPSYRYRSYPRYYPRTYYPYYYPRYYLRYYPRTYISPLRTYRR